jgi:hypothetical protein
VWEALTTRPHVVQFIGYGVQQSDGKLALVFEDSTGETQLINADALAAMLSETGVKLVVLNAGESAAGSLDAATGLADALVRAATPAVITWPLGIPQRTSDSFLVNLFRFMVDGYPLERIVTEMRLAANFDADDRFFWGTLVLLTRQRDSVTWSAPQLDARFVADVTIPENTRMQARQRFTKTWRIQESGNVVWGPEARVSFFEGQPMTTSTIQPLPQVSPGEQVDISVELTVPSEPGSYSAIWRLTDKHGKAFGDFLPIRVVVEALPTKKEGIGDSRFVADVTILDDSEIAPGTAFTKTWRVQNTGERAWGKDDSLIFIGGTPMTTETSHPLPDVPPGERVEISVAMRAPGKPGTYFGDWRMMNERGELFGEVVFLRIVVPLPSQDASPGSGQEKGSRFVMDVTIPDDSEIAAGTPFVKTWRLMNTGISRWRSDYALVFIGGNNMSVQDSVSVPDADPGKEVEVSVRMRAPETPGVYYSDWRLTDERGDQFGDVVYCRIVVPAPTGHTLANPMSQRDPRWSNERIGLAESDRTFAEWGSLMTCFTMIANSFGKNVTPSQLNEALVQSQGFVEPKWTKWNALDDAFPDIVYEGKIDAGDDMLNRIDASLVEGNPVAVQVDFTRDVPYTKDDHHWVLIVGREGKDYRINDPWILPPQEASLAQRYGRTGRPLRDAIISAIFYRSAKGAETATA